jgi:DNA-directed RNA polymerase subunit RPC12/RpoP
MPLQIRVGRRVKSVGCSVIHLKPGEWPDRGEILYVCLYCDARAAAKSEVAEVDCPDCEPTRYMQRFECRT